MANSRSGYGWRPSCCALLAFGLVAASGGKAATINTIAAIPGANDGHNPDSKLTKLDGKYYGTTTAFSSPGTGTVYRIDLKTGVETVLHTLNGTTDGANPGNLVGFGGKLYGVASGGGSMGGGTVFAIDPVTGAEQVLFNWPSQVSYAGNLYAEFRGLIYGAGSDCGTGGVSCIYSVDPGSGAVQVVYSFTDPASDGSTPVGLTLRGDHLYGLAYDGGAENLGTLFSFDPATAALRLEHSFGKRKDGSQPESPLLNVGGILYGTTDEGGTKDVGTVFSFDPETRQEVILHSFDKRDGFDIVAGLVSAGGLLYGVAFEGGTRNYGGVLFSVDPATGQTASIYNFEYPLEEPGTTLIEAGGLLYGTLFEGGAGSGTVGDGVVYSVDPATGTLSVVHSFAGPENSTTSGLIKVNASLYGTASGGGSNGLGSVFKVDPQTGAIATVYSFNGTDGALPKAALLDVGGILYGTTSTGGPDNAGTVFALDPANHKLTTLHQFTGNGDGGNPVCALSLGNGALYGTTPGGDGAYFGSVFKVDIASGAFKTIFRFSDTDGYDPMSGLISANQLLYGVTAGIGGGVDGQGTIYQIDPVTDAHTILYTFQGSDPGDPIGGLLYDFGVLYGTTPQTVFSFDLASATHTTLHSFQNRSVLEGPLAGAGGKLFGAIASSKTAPYGAIFRINASSGAVQTYPFASAAGGYPEAPLLHVGNVYYGTTRSSDTTNAGTVFKFVP